MPLRNYVICCYGKDCALEAVYKIASRWSDGVTGELKTYSLCCEACLAECFGQSRRKQALCRLAPGEALDPPSIFVIRKGAHDCELIRSEDREIELIKNEINHGEIEYTEEMIE
jgi:hypothetical protein